MRRDTTISLQRSFKIHYSLMRYLNIVIFVLFGHFVFGQKNMPVIWKTDHGIVDSGRLAKLPINLRDNYELIFYKNSKDSIAVDQNHLEWVIYQGDTLLSRQYNQSGRSELMRLLYQGEIRLYRAVQLRINRQYYLVREGQWTLLGHKNTKEMGYQVIQQNCQDFRPTKRLRSDYQAVELARQLNNCIGAYGHYSLPTYDSFKQQLGVVANIPGKKRDASDDRYRNHIDRWPTYAPTISLNYQRQLFRYWPEFSVHLNATLLHTRKEIYTTLTYPRPTYPLPAYPAKESIDITSIYIYPGLSFSSAPRKTLQFTMGAGPILALPLHSRRQVDLIEDNTAPGVPITQEFHNIVDYNIGYYIQLGVNFKIRKNIRLGFIVRREHFEQRWRYYQQFNRSILYTRAFSHSSLLAKSQVSRLQVQAQYLW